MGCDLEPGIPHPSSAAGKPLLGPLSAGVGLRGRTYGPERVSQPLLSMTLRAACGLGPGL